MIKEQAWQAGEVAVSAISYWECAMLHRHGRISLPCPVDVWRADLVGAGVVEIALDGRIAVLAAALADIHRDPADRFIVATAMHRGAILVTADSKLLDWPAELPRQDART